MKLDIREKKVLYVYGCPDYHNTVTRLKWLVSLTVDREARRWLLGLARKMETEGSGEWYPCFIAICVWKWEVIFWQNSLW